jgi:ectoine hydroxylase-related dioxygenase (phytanoyl-CoA dioxygenase family)
LNMLVMIDDFTIENGATWFLTGSHKTPQKPNDEIFFKKASRATGEKGTVVFFNSNLWHAAGTNQSKSIRRALTLNFTPPFMKQQFDYPRALGYDYCETLSERVQQLVGFFSRVPSSLNEWYQKPERRFYRPDQG